MDKDGIVRHVVAVLNGLGKGHTSNRSESGNTVVMGVQYGDEAIIDIYHSGQLYTAKVSMRSIYAFTPIEEEHIGVNLKDNEEAKRKQIGTGTGSIRILHGLHTLILKDLSNLF